MAHVPTRLLLAIAVIAVLGLAACTSETGGDREPAARESSPVLIAEGGECEQPPRAQAHDPVEAVALLYPNDFVFLDESRFAAPGYASVNVARSGKVIAAVELELRHKGGVWRVMCVTEGKFSAEYYPVPK